MAVKWVRAIQKSGGQGDGGKNQFHTKYIVKALSASATRSEILNCGLLPVYGSPNIENLQTFCCKTQATRIPGHPLLWEVEAEWNSTTASGRDPGDQQKQPDLRRPKWRARFVKFPQSLFGDLSAAGKLLADTAHTPFDPPLDIPIVGDEITISRYESVCDRRLQQSYMNAANSDIWLGAESGTVLVDDIDVDEEFIQGAYWYLTTYRILYKPRMVMKLPLGGTTSIGGWLPEYVLNAGPMALVYDSTTSKWSKKPVTHGGFYDGRPAFLDTDGTQIQIDEDTGALAKDPIFIPFATKKEASFATMDLIPPPGWFGA